MAKIIFIVPILLVALYVNGVSSIKCWDCISSNDPKCADPFDNSTIPITDCAQKKGLSDYPEPRLTVCSKIRQKVGNQLIVSRGCTWKHLDDSSNNCASTVSGPNEVRLFCETCTGDVCNGGSAIGITLALIMAPIGLLIFK